MSTEGSGWRRIREAYPTFTTAQKFWLWLTVPDTVASIVLFNLGHPVLGYITVIPPVIAASVYEWLAIRDARRDDR